MKKVYFDAILFDKIAEMETIDVFAALKMYGEYIEMYPKDYRAYSKYAKLLISVGRLNDAENILDLGEILYDSFKYDIKDRNKKFEVNHVLSKLKLFAYQNRYEDFFALAHNNKEMLCESNSSLGKIILCFRVQLGLDVIPKFSDGYIFRQAKNYSEDEFYEHIKKHSALYKNVDDTDTSSIFYEDFPLEKVISTIKDTLPNDNKICSGFLENTYYFKYDNCGRCFSTKDFCLGSDGDNKNQKSRSIITDYFEVFTFKDTNKLITICPCPTTRGYPYVDLNYLKEKDEPKRKRKSAIDKFNERYQK